ncbi:MAG: hypothetical protein AAGA54_15965 [Myxococcota bacterium]
MTSRFRSPALLLMLCSACSLFAGQPDTAQPEPASPIPQESKDMVRQGDQQVLASVKQADEEIDKLEADLAKAMKLALGQEPMYPGQPTPYKASEALDELRKAKIDLYLAPVLDAQGNPVADQFVQLQDSYTDKVQSLSRKIAEGKASKKEMKFVQDGAKHMVKINDLKGQVRAAVQPAMQTGWNVTTGSMMNLQVASHMVRTRRQMEMEWLEEDYEIIRQLIASQRRREAVGAMSLGLMATYQVALDGGDPAVIDQVAEATLGAMPFQAEATLDEAKAYIDNFDAIAESSHVAYEAQMRKTHGDAVYEAKYKAQLDAQFTRIKDASSTQSVTEMMAANQATYEAHLQMCARGEPLPPDTMVGPGKCDEAKAAGRGAELSANDLATLTGRIGDLDKKALAKRGVMMALDKIPGGKQVKRALEGVQALRDGDPTVALRLAADLVPMPGPAKMALDSAATIAEAIPKAKRNARRMRG